VNPVPLNRVADALAHAQALGLPRLDAQLLLAHALQQPRTWLLAHDDAVLPQALANTLSQAMRRRAAGEPLAYVLGEVEFCGLRLRVTPDVLIPRPETEDLVNWALTCVPTLSAYSAIDLGTGSGAIALALARAVPGLAVTATDRSSAALLVAQGNAQRLQLTVQFELGDWWAAVAGRRFGLAVSNPPYVAAADPHLAALAHEPQTALTPGTDGLAALRAVVQGAPAGLVAGAWLLLEHGHDQAPAVADLLRGRGFADVQTRHDLAGMPRCSGARWPG